MLKLAVVLFCVIIANCPCGNLADYHRCQEHDYCKEYCSATVDPSEDYLQELRDESRALWRMPRAERIGNRLYYISQGHGKYWIKATEFCEEMGAHLAVIEDDDELNTLKTRLEPETFYYVGLKYDKTKRKFVSYAPGQPDAFIKWEGGQPNDDYKYNPCMLLSTHNMRNSDCAHEDNFICKVNITFSPI